MLRIGIPTHGFRDWAGGIDFLFSVVDSLRTATDAAELHLLLPDPKPPSPWRRLRASMRRWGGGKATDPTVPCPLDCSALAGACHAVHAIPHGPEAVAAAADRLRLDAVLPSHGVLPDRMPCPWIGYLYDFQHRHLPHLFTDRERHKREHAFTRMVKAAPAVIVNSRDTADEARRLYPYAADRIHALPFNASPRTEWLAVQPPPICVPTGPYFLVSNQFWVHKDHPTAFRAFAAVARMRPDVRLVCTGQTIDYRRPEYFATLQGLLDELGICDRVTIAGLLPKAEQIELMKRAVALVQPTLCEGGPGGGAVYDAVSLGVPAIVSDIPINRELADEPTVVFFVAGDAGSLAASMRRALDSDRPRPPAADLRGRGLARRAACGRTILGILAVLGQSPRPA